MKGGAGRKASKAMENEAANRPHSQLNVIPYTPSAGQSRGLLSTQHTTPTTKCKCYNNIACDYASLLICFHHVEQPARVYYNFCPS